MVAKTRIGVDPVTGLDIYEYDLSDHPGMQDPDVTKHTHVIHKTPVGFAGTVTLEDGTTYDLSDDYIDVPIEHSDEVELKAHAVALATGLTTDVLPEKGAIQTARDAFIAAGWTPPTE